MYSSGQQIPVHTNNPNGRELRRHHTAKYYMHRVKESLTTRVSKLICSIVLTLLLIMGILTFILWLSLRPHRPRIHIHDFTAPGLAQPNGFQNAQVTFNVAERNSNQNIGIYYDTTQQVTLFYQDQSIGGTELLFPYYQQPKNTTVLSGVLSGATLTVSNQRWAQFQSDVSRGIVVFRLEVSSAIRFKVSTWNSRRHKMHANCEVGVGPDGSILTVYKDRRCPTYFT